MLFTTTQQINLPACSSHLNVKQEAVNTNFNIIGLTTLGIKPKSIALEADALTTRLSELLNMCPSNAERQAGKLSIPILKSSV